MIEVWYTLVDSIFPFSWVEFDFMKNALLAVLLVSPIFGFLGTIVVNNNMAFFSDAIGHAALTGIAIGVVLGLGDPLWAMLIFAAVLAIGITWTRHKTGASVDTVIGVFFSTTVALGVVILSRGGGFNRYSNYLIGDLLSISPQELTLLAFALLVVLLFWGLFFNRLFLTSINQAVARSRGVNVYVVEMLFSVLLAMFVTISIQWIGILIINALLILPAASARNLAVNMRSYHFLAVVISIVAGLAGLFLSYHWGTATGATIVLCIFVLYLGTIAWKTVSSRWNKYGSRTDRIKSSPDHKAG
ncbi:MAG: metal ABC transporter permease [Syntrophomonadaceae bacterium]|nr:metal ABC transporter permease [Syntrophomonadaceae bacterium]